MRGQGLSAPEDVVWKIAQLEWQSLGQLAQTQAVVQILLGNILKNNKAIHDDL